MKRSGKISGWLLIAVLACGLVLGPGYLFYCWFFSGSAAGEYPITVGKPLELELSPEMNPIRFNSTIEYHVKGGSGDKLTNFRGTLKQADRQLWTTTFGVSEDPDEDPGIQASYSSIRTFSVDRPGPYVFLVTPGRRSELRVRSITLKVRKNVTHLNVPVTVIGWVLLVPVLILGLALRGIKSGKPTNRPGQ